LHCLSAAVIPFQGALGIDIGTSYLRAGVYVNGRVEIISNAEGNRATPSFVAFTDTEVLTGEAAQVQFRLNGKNTVLEAKRLLGLGVSDTSFCDSVSKRWLAHVEWSVSDGGFPSRVPRLTTKMDHKGEYQGYTPEELLAFQIAGVKAAAEAHLGMTVR
ncbi:unnamed protein product, partial [Sphacelaria rigidula]